MSEVTAIEPKKLDLVVDQELVDYIERLSYEESSLKDIILTYLDAHKADADDSAVNNVVFASYQEKHFKAKTEYELAKQRVTHEYIPACLENHQYDWNLDYATNVLTITVYCECGIKALEEYLCKLTSQQTEE